MLEQSASETLIHNVMTIHSIRHGGMIITSHKHDKQNQLLADVKVSPSKASVRSYD